MTVLCRRGVARQSDFVAGSVSLVRVEASSGTPAGDSIGLRGEVCRRRAAVGRLYLFRLRAGISCPSADDRIKVSSLLMTSLFFLCTHDPADGSLARSLLVIPHPQVTSFAMILLRATDVAPTCRQRTMLSWAEPAHSGPTRFVDATPYRPKQWSGRRLSRPNGR